LELTPSSDGDSPVLPDLLNQIPEDAQIGTVTAPLGGKAACRAVDGAYDTRRCDNAIIQRGAEAIGVRIMARDPDRQTAEIHIRIALMNRFSALGTAEIIRVD